MVEEHISSIQKEITKKQRNDILYFRKNCYNMRTNRKLFGKYVHSILEIATQKVRSIIIKLENLAIIGVIPNALKDN
jgi:hypothetical protein